MMSLPQLVHLIMLATIGTSVISLQQVAIPLSEVARIVSAIHWSPCYALNNSIPSLHDGAIALAASGTKSIKLVLSGDPPYPWNTNCASQASASEPERPAGV